MANKNILFCFCLFAVFLLTSSQEDYCNGVICEVGEVCQVATCTPLCVEGEPCPHDPCGAFCVPAPVTPTTEEGAEEEYCEGVVCGIGEICQVAICTPMCIEGEPCPHEICGAYCAPDPAILTTPKSSEEEYCKGVVCGIGEICRVSICTPMCVDEEPCPHEICGAYCAPDPATLTTQKSAEEEYCKGVVCGIGEICQVAICTPMCIDGEPCPHEICDAYCVPDPTTPTTQKSLEEEYCDGVKCGTGEICQVATCTPMCIDGEPCPHEPCGAYCAPDPETTSTTQKSLQEEYCNGVVCESGQICQVAICTPMCVEGEICPQLPCGAYCAPDPVTSSTTEGAQGENCDGAICEIGEICQVAYCTPFCVEGEPCPHEPCGAFCVPDPVTSTTEAREYCDGTICEVGQVCQIATCTPWCIEGGPCPHLPCGGFCVPAPEAAATEEAEIDSCSGVSCPDGLVCEVVGKCPGDPCGVVCIPITQTLSGARTTETATSG